MNKVMKMKPETEAEEIKPAAEETPRPRKRGRRLMLILLVPLLLAAGGAYLWISGGRYEETENAYFHQARVAIASDLSGRVVEVEVADNATVSEGDVLFRIDPEPYRIALSETEAAIADARLQIAQMKAAYQQARAQEKAARDDVAYLSKELDRQRALAERGVATTAKLDDAEHSLRAAKEKLTAAEQATASARAALGDDPDAPVDSQPSVRSALAARERAAYNLDHTAIRAPGDGVVYQAASFREGQFVGAGEQVFSLVETGDAWVDANFKETQLTHIAKGQSAEVSFDIYPGQSFAAKVDAIGAGTGSEFSLLPAQNATGNWVKVTQRVPVRVRLAAALPEGVDLVSGASATVTVDTGRSRTLPGLTALAHGAE